jgi:ribonuclease HI
MAMLLIGVPTSQAGGDSLCGMGEAETSGGTTPAIPGTGGPVPPSPPGPPGGKPAVIYTDGACSGNPGPGGWGVVLRYGTVVKELHGSDPLTTNNRMELTAAIQALEALTRPVPVTLYTDSRYVLDGITKWLPGWQRNGWRTSGRHPVKNVDLWQRLVAAMAAHDVTWRWVKGHNGDPGNERADELARLGIAEAVAAARI